jgi:hypothetical protein
MNVGDGENKDLSFGWKEQKSKMTVEDGESKDLSFGCLNNVNSFL